MGRHPAHWKRREKSAKETADETRKRVHRAMDAARDPANVTLPAVSFLTKELVDLTPRPAAAEPKGGRRGRNNR